MLYFRMKLFYGSKTLLTRPAFGEGKPSNEYGLDFYLTPERALADLCAELHQGTLTL